MRFSWFKCYRVTIGMKLFGMKKGEAIMGRKRFGLAIIVILTIFLITLSSENFVYSAELKKLKVGRIGQAIYYVTLFAADKKGFYKEQGLDVEIIVIPKVEMMQALVTGGLDIGLPTTDYAIVVASKGARVKMIGSYIQRGAYDLIVQPQYKSIKDLKGKIIGVPDLKSGLTLMVQKLLKDNGLGPKDYDIIRAGNNMERMAALKSKNIAAAAIVDPANYIMNDEGYPTLANTVTSFPDYDFDSWWVAERWADKNEDTIVKFLKAFIKAQQWVDDPNNKEEAITLIEQEVKIKRDYARRGYEDNIEKYKTLAKNAVTDRKGIDVVINLIKELGEFGDKPAPPISAFLDEKYLQKAHKELGIK